MVRSIYQQITYLDPVVYDWPHIKVKTLVLGGDLDGQDFPALAKHIADTIPDARLVVVPNAGHVLHLEVPETFYRELLKFLKSSALDGGDLFQVTRQAHSYPLSDQHRPTELQSWGR